MSILHIKGKRPTIGPPLVAEEPKGFHCCRVVVSVSRRFFERLGLVSIPSVKRLGIISVSASYVSFT